MLIESLEMAVCLLILFLFAPYLFRFILSPIEEPSQVLTALYSLTNL